MKKLLTAAVALAAIGLSAATASAELRVEGGYYFVESSSGETRVIGRAASQPRVVAPQIASRGSSQAPRGCAFGDFWESSSGTLMACAGAHR